MNNKRQEIEKYKKKIVELERQMEEERRQKLVNLHEQLGYESRDELISALQGLGRGKAAATKAKGGKRGKRGKRTVITPELRSQILDAIKSGKSGTAVAKEFGVSVPTVQNIKKQGGLVKKRK